jgi:hypothetical protein
MELVVDVPGRPSHRVKLRTGVPLLYAARLTASTPLPVRVDPENSDLVEIMWETAALPLADA